jgi:hypothetical protein
MNYDKGDISDEISENLASVLINEGQAEKSDSVAFLRATTNSEMAKIKDGLTEEVRKLLTEVRGGKAAPSGPPNGTGVVNQQQQADNGQRSLGSEYGTGLVNQLQVDSVQHSSSPVDREVSKFYRSEADRLEGKPLTEAQRGSFGRALKWIGIVGKPSLHHAQQVAYAQRCLMAMSGHAQEYAFDENSGTFVETQRRVLPGGGVETITRTGTDSLSGGSTYGFALKPEYLGNLFEISMEQQVFVNASQSIPVTQGNEVKWPAWDQYRYPTVANGVTQSAVFAGIQLYYEGESAARVESDALLNMINFKVVDLTFFTAISRDFQKDNHLAFDAALTRMFGRAVGWMEDYMSIQGPGSGKPQGYVNGPSTLVVNRANANKISSNDLTQMIAAVSPMVWDDLRWITNITTFPQLSILANSAGTAIFQPNALISQAKLLSIMDKSIGGRGAELMHRPMGDLLGFPVYFSEKVATLGNTADLSLVAPSQYGVARREGLEMGVSEHFYFSTDLIAYRGKLRHDMKPLWRAPYFQADGSNTQVSPFVILH